jgi:CBS domain-containing protein
MQHVKHLLENKGHETFAIEPEAPVLEAIKRMAERGIGSLLVMENSRLTGIVTERDYARKVILQGRSSATSAVRDIMSAHVLTVSPDTRVEECMRLCTDSRVRHLPVVEGERVVGIVSIGDLVKAVIDDQAQAIEQLQRYIAS